MVELVQVVLAGEDWAVGEHLRQDAAHGPHVDRLVVTLPLKYEPSPPIIDSIASYL